MYDIHVPILSWTQMIYFSNIIFINRARDHFHESDEEKSQGLMGLAKIGQKTNVDWYVDRTESRNHRRTESRNHIRTGRRDYRQNKKKQLS